MTISISPESNKNSRLYRRAAIAGVTAVLVALSTIIAAPAYAYNTTGCRWRDTSLRVDIRYVNGDYRTAIGQATANYRGSTRMSLTTTSDSTAFRAENSNYGANGWEGQNTWYCPLGVTHDSKARLNAYYLSGASVARLKVVWLHELGHGVGLDHVSTKARVMNTSASSGYYAGVRSLTTDEISGVNYVYR